MGKDDGARGAPEGVRAGLAHEPFLLEAMVADAEELLVDVVLGRKGVRLVRAVAEVGPHVGELAGESPLLHVKFGVLMVSLRECGMAGHKACR